MKTRLIMLITVLLFAFNIGTHSSHAEQNGSTGNEATPATENSQVTEPVTPEPVVEPVDIFKTSAVQNLTSTTPTATTVQLNWDALLNATSYEIYQSTNPETDFKLVKTVSTNSFTVPNIVPGSTNYFKVRAVQTTDTTIHYSLDSTVVSAKTTLATPASLKVSTKTPDSVTLSWGKVDGAKGYEVYMATSKNGTYTKVATTASTSFTHGKLATNKTYFYKVKAYSQDTATYYSSDSTIVSAAISLATPTNVKVTKKTYNSVTLSWSKIAGAKGYEVYMSTSKNGKYTKVTTTSASSFTHTKLATNKTYYYKVRAYGGTKPVYSAHSAIASASISLPAPAKLKVANKTHNSATLSWNKVTGATGYQIYMATSKNGKYKKIKTTTASSFKHSNLTPNKTYYYKVRAYTGAKPAYSKYTNVVSAKASLVTPSTLKVANKTYNSVTLSWGKVSGAKGYEVYMATSKKGKYKKVKTTTASSFKHTRLSTNKTYYYKVRAYAKHGKKTVYNPYAAVTGKPVLNAVPAVKTKNEVNYITLSWGTVSGATDYKVYRSTSKNGKFSLLKTTKSRTYTDKSVKKRTTYYYKIVANRKVGKKVYTSASSKVISAITRMPMEPNIEFEITNKPNTSTKVLEFWLYNRGTKTFKILSDGFFIHDLTVEESPFDSPLAQIDANTKKHLEWMELPTKATDKVAFTVIGKPTQFIDNSAISFIFTYDSVKYAGFVSNIYGFGYDKIK